MVTITSTNGYKIMIDEEDFDMVSKYHWYVSKTNSNNYYALRHSTSNGKRTKMYLHREVMGATKGDIIDHIDMNGLNCQKANLRLSSKSMNAYNRRSFGAIDYLGVSKHKDKFRMQIYVQGRRYSKVCDTAEEAAMLYNEYAKKFHGDYARLNVIR